MQQKQKSFLELSFLKIFTLVFLSFSALQTIQAATLSVHKADSSGCSGTYTSIKDALSHANDDDVIEICPGTYNESDLVINKNNLTIKGLGNSVDDVFIDGSSNNNVFIIDKGNTTFENFKAASKEEVIFGKDHNGNYTYRNLHLISNNSHGIYMDYMSGTHIFDNLTLDTKEKSIYLIHSTGNFSFTNLTITSTNGQGIYIDGPNSNGELTFNGINMSSGTKEAGIQIKKVAKNVYMKDLDINASNGYGIIIEDTISDQLTIINAEVNSYKEGILIKPDIPKIEIKNSLIQSSNQQALLSDSSKSNATISGNCFYGPKLIEATQATYNYDGNYYDGVTDKNGNGKIDNDDSDKLIGNISDSNFMTTCDRTSPPDDFTCANPKDFSLAYSGVKHGDIKIIGNTNICMPDSNGQCTDPGDTGNNDINAIWKDGDNQTTDNSSAAKLALDDNSSILWAGLYWQGYFANYDITSENQEGSKHIKLGFSETKHGSVSYENITADRLNHVYFSSKRWYYQGFKDVTDFVKEHKSGWYWGSDIKTTLGKPAGGTLGAWSIAIAYENGTMELKNLSIFDGYIAFASDKDNTTAKKYAQDHNCDTNNTGLEHEFEIPLSGFLTPKAGDLSARMIFLAGEGDIRRSGDNMYLADKSGTYHQIFNDANPKNNIANSSISVDGVDVNDTMLYPRYGYNTIGIDIDEFDVSNILNHDQSSTKIKLNSTGDAYFPGAFGLSVNLFSPNICYDYTYGQDGYYMTAPNTSTPSIDGTFDKSTPIDVKLYFQNQENSDITISNLNIDVDPIDISKAKYSSNSVAVTPPGGTKTAINDSSLTIAADGSSLKNIPIGDFGSLEYFYTYYSLDANISDIHNMPINAVLNYHLTANVNGSTVDLGDQTSLIQDMSICNSSPSYNPIPSLYNVVESSKLKPEGYYDFNISTQIVNDPVDFTVESLKSPYEEPDINASIERNVTINVVDMAGFHYTRATCTDPDTTIVIGSSIDTHFNNGDTNVSLNPSAVESSGMFTRASQNAAFRLTYMDGNNTQIACSRDNFAIRPYAFRVFGKNQYKRAGEDFNITMKGVDEANANKNGSGQNLNVVHGTPRYNAKLEDLNLTAHFYVPTAAEIAQMQSDTGKNDVASCRHNGIFMIHNSSSNFVDGELNTSLNFSETGILNIVLSEKKGSEWAKVDAKDTIWEKRQIKPALQTYNESDINKTILQLFIPYSFKTNATYSTTINKNWLYQADINSSNHTFTTPKIAAYLLYTIKAKNKSGVIVQNYTKTCFPDTSETGAPRVNGLKLNTTFDLYLDLDLNSTADINASFYSEDNSSHALWTRKKNYSFNKGKNSAREWISPFQFENGEGQAKVYFNIDRNNSIAVNPIQITILDVNTSISWMSNPGSPKEFNGTILNQNKNFLYGRTHATRQRFEVPANSHNSINTYSTNIYYEVYCFDNGVVNDCNKTLLPNGTNSKHSDDLRWYINTNHNTATDGNVTDSNITDVGFGFASGKAADSTHTTDANITYNGSVGYPYKTTMENNASDWLIYNPDNPNAKRNKFSVEFYKAGTIWNGEHETNTTTKGANTAKTNRRVMW